MADKKNLCAQIDTALHARVRQEQEQSGQTLSEFVEQLMLIPPDVTPQRQSYTYANEADVLNVALFGITAKEWRQAHPDSKGNIRDEASLQQLIVLANMESINAELIRQGVPQSERLLRLNASAKQMMQSLTNDHRIEAFKEYGTLPHESE